MKEPYAHAMMPRANHDELARQNFVASARIHSWDNVHPGLKAVYEGRAKNEFSRRYKREPASRHDVHRAMDIEPYYQMWSSLSRSLREMHWDGVGESVERQLPDLIESRRRLGATKGSLRLDPGLKQPRYMSAVDIHAMPGGYHSDLVPDDVFAGAVSDRCGYYHILMFLGARAHTVEEKPGKLVGESFATDIIGYANQMFPDLKVRRILDIGCCIGRNTLPYADAFPDAEIHAIDLSAPQLRYGFARAQFFNKSIHFSQQNAEKTIFPDQHFDLVVSSAVLHETSRTASASIMREAFRLLRPGGVTIHFERDFYRDMPPFQAFLEDWECYYDNEPFKATWREIDPKKLLADAGFEPENIVQHSMALGADGATQYLEPGKGRGGIFGAQKVEK